MHEEIIIWGIIAAVVLGYILIAGILAYNKKVRTITRIKEEYGRPPVWTMDERDYNSMKQYYRLFPPASPIVDDITWHDLDMDKVFQRMKNTQSSVGDEVSYRRFRQQRTEDLDHFEKATQSMQDNEEARIRFQYAFHRIGRETDNGLIDLLHDPSRFPRIPMPLILGVTLAGLAGLAWLYFSLDIGFIVVTFTFLASIILFYYVLHRINPAMEVLGMFTRVIRAARLIVKSDIKGLEAERETLQHALKKFRRTGSVMDLVIHCCAIGRSGQGGNLFTMVMAYFGIYAFAYQTLVRQFAKNKEDILILYEIVGRVELYISTASYRESVSGWCKPTFAEESRLQFTDIVHPLLKKPIPNSHKTGNKMLITGSNASGKSPFSKTLAVNALLGQLFHTCLAKNYTYRPCSVLSSMSLQDDITAGDSFYVAEVKSLKRLMEQALQPGYTMLFLDEIFKGTNMVERIAAASIILKRLAQLDCFVCLATHDMELCTILGSRYENYHFQEEVTRNDIRFDYKLRTGMTTGSNAIKLLAYCGYEPDLVKDAEHYAGTYRKTGEWVAF